MEVSIEDSWKTVLKDEFNKPYFKELARFVKKEYNQHTCYPPGNRIFSAFDHCPFEKTRVVIIGQDPYHGEGQANGLCFSVYPGVEKPPSLLNIFKEIKQETGAPIPESGSLERWADQGVLLLNAVLTVRAHEAGSHKDKGWEIFTNRVIQLLSEKQNGVIFLLWGGFAKKKNKLIDPKKHHVLTSGHPSPLSANRGYWFGNGHFNQANDILKAQNSQPISW